MVSGERELFFHISSKRSSKGTDSSRFRDHIFRALREMRDILTLALDAQSKSKALTGGGAGAGATKTPAS
jgi:hypothetical protein